MTRNARKSVSVSVTPGFWGRSTVEEGGGFLSFGIGSSFKNPILRTIPLGWLQVPSVQPLLASWQLTGQSTEFARREREELTATCQSHRPANGGADCSRKIPETRTETSETHGSAGVSSAGACLFPGVCNWCLRAASVRLSCQRSCESAFRARLWRDAVR